MSIAMTATTEHTQDDSEERRALAGQVAAVLSLHGLPDSPQVQALMEPLLSGQLTYEEHMEMLESMMQRLQDAE